MTTDADRLTFQLAYGDCDAVGIAYFAIYYPWMERLYTTWMYSHGIRAGELTERFGVFTVGMQSECRYFAPCRVFDVLSCQLVLDHIGTSSYQLGFDFTRDGEIVTHGRILYACRSIDGTKAPIPAEIRSALESLPVSPHSGAAGSPVAVPARGRR